MRVMLSTHGSEGTRQQSKMVRVDDHSGVILSSISSMAPSSSMTTWQGDVSMCSQPRISVVLPWDKSLPVERSGSGPRILTPRRHSMPYSPILIGHICAGTLGLLSGTAAMSFRKGSPRHVLAGKVFVASMLTMAVAAVYLAIVRHQPNNVGGGILTFYLIGTAWLTARRRDGETSRFDWVVLLIPLALGILTWMNGIKIVRSGASSQDGVPVGMTFFMGSVMLLAAAGDFRMLVGGVPVYIPGGEVRPLEMSFTGGMALAQTRL
jgi:uncharacterized membrane protein